MRRDLGHVPELDGLRGLAALGVFVLHVFNSAIDPLPPAAVSPTWKLLSRLAGFGTLGVDVFFVLSGFLITSLLLADRANPSFFRDFYAKRLLRIQPVYLVHMLLAWFLLPNSHGYVLLGFVFLVNFDAQFHVPDVGPAWSLSIEEQFYLVWPQLVRRISLATLFRVCIGLAIFSSALRTGMILIAHHADVRSTWYRLDGLAIGALLACQWMGEGESQTTAVRRFLRLFNSTAALVAACAAAALFILGLTRNIGLAMLPANYLTYRLIRYVLAYPSSRRFGWMGARPLVFLGAISYSSYMLHTIFLSLYDRRVPPETTLDPFRFAVRAGVVALATLVSCLIVRHGVELPAQRLRRYLVSRP